MNFNLNLFNAVVAAGILQALFTFVWIWRQPVKNNRQKMLGAVLLVLALLAFKILLHTLDWWNTTTWRYFPLAIDTLLQPLLYLYTCSLTNKHFSFSRRQWPHFIIPTLFLIHAVVVYLCTAGVTDIAEKDLIAAQFRYNTVKLAEDILAIASAFIYGYGCFSIVNNYRKWLFAHESATRYQELTWLRNLLLGSVILVLLLALSSLAANIFHWPYAFNYLVIFYVYLVLLIYFLSFRGYEMAFSGERIPPYPASKESGPEKEMPSAELSPGLADALVKLMQEDKPYLDPELNMSRLARLVGVPAAQVSAAINSHFGQNFRNWVNSYRVEEVKKRLANPAFSHLNIAGIAFDCGFNSEASFYRIFRQFTGQSPKAYLKSLKSRD